MAVTAAMAVPANAQSTAAPTEVVALAQAPDAAAASAQSSQSVAAETAAPETAASAQEALPAQETAPAQEVPPAPAVQVAPAASVNSSGLAEVIVTAERRSTRAQNTAIALDVVTGEALRNNGVGDISQLQTVAPGVIIGQNATATVVTVRGVSSRDVTEIGDPAVAINVDGLFLQRPTGMNAAFFDLNRIEVLRGPQGTLYGRNATGGVINILTQRPTQQFGGYAALTGGNFGTLNLEGALNVPLTDSVAMRASYFSRQHDGYRNNANPANPVQSNGRSTDGDDEDSKGARLQLLAKPNKDFSALFSGTYIKQGGNGPVLNGYPIATAPTTPPDSRSETKNYPLNQPGSFDAERVNLLTQLDYDLGLATVTYLGGYVDLKVKHLYDNDGLATSAYEFSRNEKSKDYSHELRLASNNKQGLIWQGGLFYYKQDLDVRSFNFLNPNGVPVILRDFNYQVHVKSKAAFGQASLDLFDGLKASAGVRYTKDDKDRAGYRLAAASLTPPASQVNTNTVPLTNIPETDGSRSSSNKTTYHAGLDYQVTPDNLVYAKVDKGYKAGGFTAISAYKPESLLAYELGSKNRFLKNRLQVNLSAFYYDYSDQQVSQTVTSGPFTGAQTVVNAGKSELKGAEAQVNWRVTQDDKVDFSLNYLDAKFKEFSVANGASNLSLAGNRLIQSPKWSVSGGYEHVFNLENGGKITPRVQTQYRTESFLTFYNRSNDRQKAYSLVDATLTYIAPEEKWSVQAFVRNIGDTVVLTAADQGGPYGSLRYQFGAPRTFGVRLQADF
jgi:iron complex outermembrane receptor protein